LKSRSPIRRPAAEIREAVHGGDSWRDHLATSWDHAESESPEAYDAPRDSALAEADALEKSADEEKERP
jgi:hypothetical protein